MHIAEVSAASEGTVIPVVPYSVFWLILGCILLLAIPLYYLLAWLWTRPREVLPDPPPVPQAATIERARSEAMTDIGRIEREFREGRLSARRAHAELSRVVRGFVTEATGVRADRMTLAEMRRTPFAGATRAVAEYYPIVFGARDQGSAEQGFNAARQVVTLWR